MHDAMGITCSRVYVKSERRERAPYIQKTEKQQECLDYRIWRKPVRGGTGKVGEQADQAGFWRLCNNWRLYPKNDIKPGKAYKQGDYTCNS